MVLWWPVSEVEAAKIDQARRLFDRLTQDAGKARPTPEKKGTRK